jgi:hypothetical protein
VTAAVANGSPSTRRAALYPPPPPAYVEIFPNSNDVDGQNEAADNDILSVVGLQQQQNSPTGD